MDWNVDLDEDGEEEGEIVEERAPATAIGSMKRKLEQLQPEKSPESSRRVDSANSQLDAVTRKDPIAGPLAAWESPQKQLADHLDIAENPPTTERTTAANEVIDETPDAAPDPHEGQVGIHQVPMLWQLVVQTGGLQALLQTHPDVQPLPPGAFEIPAVVELMAARDEAAAARSAERRHGVEARNRQLLDLNMTATGLCDCPPRKLAPSQEELWHKLMQASLSKRLVVYCGGAATSAGGSDRSFLEHPAVVAHTAVLELVVMLNQEECTRRGDCDSYTDLWRALEAELPLVVFHAPCASRRARKQLLHRLSKAPCATTYVWEALGGGEQPGVPQPSLDEGWARVL